MCGIGGIRKFGDTPINATEISTMLCSLEHRGMHATGIALMTDGEIHICKDAKPAWAFVADQSTKDFLDAFLTDDTTIALLHTRAATLGSPEDNNNNHPFFMGKTAIVHNGMISNHLSLFNMEKVERSAETDSDIIRGLLDKGGLSEEGIKLLCKMSGSAAIAAISNETPDRLLLARSGSPLAYATSRDKLWFASEMGVIQRAVRPWSNRFGMPARGRRDDVDYHTMPDNSAYVLDMKERILRQEFKSCGHYTQPNYSAMRESYGTKTRNWKEESRRERLRLAARTNNTTEITNLNEPGAGFLKKIAPCPKCHKLWSIPKEKSFKGFFCNNKKCKAPLEDCDKIPADKLTYDEPDRGVLA